MVVKASIEPPPKKNPSVNVVHKRHTRQTHKEMREAFIESFLVEVAIFTSG